MNIPFQRTVRQMRAAQSAEQALAEKYPDFVGTWAFPANPELVRLEGVVDFMAAGMVRCPCGCKYWEHGNCIDCETKVEDTPEGKRLR